MREFSRRLTRNLLCYALFSGYLPGNTHHMGIHDRDYIKEEGGGPGGRPGLTVVQWLLAINIVLSLIGWVVADRGGRPLTLVYGNFSFKEGIAGLQVWRILTYQFLHEKFFHLLFNMMVLHFFGPILERQLGAVRFLTFYLLCGVAGALVMSAVCFIPGLLPYGPETPMIGASGAIYGVVIGVAVYYPDLRVRLLLPPVELAMRTLAWLTVGLSLVFILTGSDNLGGEACHLGGAVLGFLLARNPHWIPVFRISGASRRPKMRATGPVFPTPSGGPGGYRPPTRAGQPSREEIDRVLDKISAEGIHSLTAAEKRVLEAAREDLK